MNLFTRLRTARPSRTIWFAALIGFLCGIFASHIPAAKAQNPFSPSTEVFVQDVPLTHVEIRNGVATIIPSPPFSVHGQPFGFVCVQTGAGGLSEVRKESATHPGEMMQTGTECYVASK